jgi:histidyl-tRNA synthetase
VDYVGTDSSIAELEVLGAMLDAMNRLSFSNLNVRINDRQILAAVLKAAAIDEEKSDNVLTLVDKLDKIGKDGVISKLQHDVGVTDEQLGNLTALIPGLSDEPAAQPFKHLGRELETRGAPTAALERMQSLIEGVEEESYDGQRIVFDPTLVRGMSYYTGPIFEFGSPEFDGSIAGGGRYDGLVGMFSGKDVPAVGGSLGLERILVIMDELDMYPKVSQSLDVLFVQLDEKALPHVFRAASSLRKEGFSVSVYPESTKLGKQFRYAESIGARYVALLGSREVEAGTVEIKDLETGNQEAVPADEVSSYVKKLPGT